MNNMKKRLLFITFLMLVGVSFFLFPFHKKSSIKIPIVFTVDSYHPLIRAEIQGKIYSFLVDSGSTEKLYLSTSVFDQIQKSESKKLVKLYDLRGNPYQWHIYSVPDVKIDSKEPFELEIVEESPQFHENTCLWKPTKRSTKPDSHGRIGWQFFSNYCTLIDFPNSSIFKAKSIEDLENDGVLKIDHFIPIPFTIEDGVLVISIETDLGKNRVILDTGSTFCTLKRDKVVSFSPGKFYFPSSKLIINGCNFGYWNFALTDFTDRMKTDGLLGADFFLEHAVCLDFENQIAYIQKPVGILATQWKRGKYYLTQFLLRNFSDLSKVEDL